MNSIYKKLTTTIEESKIKTNEDMSKHTSFKAGGKAKFYIKAKTVEDVINTVKISKENNIPITSFVVNSLVGTSGYYTWEQAAEMDKSKVVSIYSHSLKHDNYANYSADDLLLDVNTSLKEIEEKLGHTIEKVFTYPYGLYNEENQKILLENNIIQNLTDNKINKSNSLNLFGLHRMYPLEDPVWKILLKIEYRGIKYK